MWSSLTLKVLRVEWPISTAGTKLDSKEIPTPLDVKSNKLEQVNSPLPRTGEVPTFFSNIRSLGNFAIKWVKEIPQKIAIYKIKTIERNALRAITAAVETDAFEKQVENISKFFECAEQLKGINKKISKVPGTMQNSYLDRLGRSVPIAFDDLYGILCALDNACNDSSTGRAVDSKCPPLRDFLKSFIKEYATSEQHQLVERLSRYSEN